MSLLATHRLLRLHCAGQGLGVGEALLVARLVRASGALTALDISRNSIVADDGKKLMGVAALADALRLSHTLVSLRIDANEPPLSDAAALPLLLAVATAAGRLPPLQPLPLRRLTLAGNQLTVLPHAFTACLGVHRTLACLGLERNSFPPAQQLSARLALAFNTAVVPPPPACCQALLLGCSFCAPRPGAGSWLRLLLRLGGEGRCHVLQQVLLMASERRGVRFEGQIGRF